MSTVSYKALALWAQATETIAVDTWSSLFTSGSPLEGVKEVTLRNFHAISEKLKRHNIGSEFFEVTAVSCKADLRHCAQQLMKFLRQRNLWLAKWDVNTAECLFLFLQYKGQLKRAKARVKKSGKEISVAKLVLRADNIVPLETDMPAREQIRSVRGDPVGRKRLLPSLEIDWDVGTMVTVFAVLVAGLLLIDRTTYVAGVAWWYTILGGLLFGIFYFLAFPPLVLVSEKRRMARGERR